VHEDGVGEQNP